MIQMIAPSRLRLPERVRKAVQTKSEHYKALRDNIAANGIKVPLLVRPATKGLHTIIDGAARYQIALELHLQQVPIQVTE